MTHAPEFMPVLGRGSHVDPRNGACVMEYVSVLAGEKFTDSPECTHGVLAQTAITVNDQLEDHERHLLVPFIGRLIDTRDDSIEVTGGIIRAMTEYLDADKHIRDTGEHHLSFGMSAAGRFPMPQRQGEHSVTIPQAGMGMEHSIIGLQECKLSAEFLVGFLDAAVTAFEQITLHTPRELTETDYRELAAVTR